MAFPPRVTRLEQVNRPFSSLHAAGAMAFVQALREDRLVSKVRPREEKKARKQASARITKLRTQILTLSPEAQTEIKRILTA